MVNKRENERESVLARGNKQFRRHLKYKRPPAALLPKMMVLNIHLAPGHYSVHVTPGLVGNFYPKLFAFAFPCPELSTRDGRVFSLGEPRGVYCDDEYDIRF